MLCRNAVSIVKQLNPIHKYPLPDYMNEPDTNRLARGNIDGTHIKFKDDAIPGVTVLNKLLTVKELQDIILIPDTL